MIDQNPNRKRQTIVHLPKGYNLPTSQDEIIEGEILDSYVSDLQITDPFESYPLDEFTINQWQEINNEFPKVDSESIVFKCYLYKYFRIQTSEKYVALLEYLVGLGAIFALAFFATWGFYSHKESQPTIQQPQQMEVKRDV